jgi:hypothetical protein
MAVTHSLFSSYSTHTNSTFCSSATVFIHLGKKPRHALHHVAKKSTIEGIMPRAHIAVAGESLVRGCGDGTKPTWRVERT